MRLAGFGSRGRAAGLLLALAALAGGAYTQGCSKEKESLILVSVSAADSTTPGLLKLVVSCAGTTQVFNLLTPITTSPINIGLYVPASVTGSQQVTAKAVGTQCGPGYSGSTTVDITIPGGTNQAPAIVMNDATTCPPTSGGMGGAGGNSACAAAAPPPVNTPPALTCCVEYDQVTPEVCGAAGTEIDSTVFSPNGKLLVTAGVSSQGAAGTLVGNDVKVWSFDGHTLTPVTTLNSNGWLGMAFSPDGTKLAVAVQYGVDLYNTSTWAVTPLAGSSNFFSGVGFTPDSQKIIATDRVMSTTTGNLYLFDLTASVPSIPVTTVALKAEPDSMAVASTAVGGQLGVAIAYGAGTMDVFGLANTTFSGPANVTVDASGSQIWNPAFSPDGTLIAISDSVSQIHFWAFPVPATLAESGTPITFSPTDSTDLAYGLAFSPNGNYLAAGGGDTFGYTIDPRLSIFTVSGRTQMSTTALSNNPSSVAFSPSGNAVAGGEVDCGRVFVCTN